MAERPGGFPFLVFDFTSSWDVVVGLLAAGLTLLLLAARFLFAALTRLASFEVVLGGLAALSRFLWMLSLENKGRDGAARRDAACTAARRGTYGVRSRFVSLLSTGSRRFLFWPPPGFFPELSLSILASNSSCQVGCGCCFLNLVMMRQSSVSSVLCCCSIQCSRADASQSSGSPRWSRYPRGDPRYGLHREGQQSHSRSRYEGTGLGATNLFNVVISCTFGASSSSRDR